MVSDLLLTGQRIFTGLTDAPGPGAVFVCDGVIAATGAEALKRGQAAGVEHRDAGTGLISASFTDAHIHPVFGGLQLITCHLGGDDAATESGYLDIVERYSRDHPELEWITGGGWAMPVFPGGTPTRQALDAVVPDRPVYLINRDAHGAWVNTEALRRAGIDATTPDPDDGVIEREPDGFPSGTLHEGAASLVARMLPPVSDDTALRALLVAQEALFALGVTAWQDAIIGEYLGQPDTAGPYQRAVETGALRAKVVGALWWDRRRGAEQIADLVERRSSLSAGRFQATTVKMMLDGVAENFTASMIEPYLHRCGHEHPTGVDFVDPAALAGYLRELDRLGFQVHFHALGDGAVRSALDALQALRESGTDGTNRHHLAHLQVVHPDDIARFAEVGAAANLQALWAAHDDQVDELVIPFLGPERDAMQYPFRSLVDAGTRIGAGSDWPVSDANPIAAIHTAVNRNHRGSLKPDFHPEQRLTLAQMWRAYTSGSAYLNHAEDRTGTIEVGKQADLVVLDRDPFAAPTEEIADARVVTTYLDGEVVYAST
ncbi:amidohydrolase [Jatrophihabitans telluris]|uniref:Amidohydrolase n=1 Tax=Jatrophihabitans telluris TaxID=2038343 RepID=A0ABY4R247_9ACTN|nr:amidohydrolase [Jatrophihabitans telluris]UQX89557.1 amidohydrolase [Jatrophihabitans telluris]